MTLHHFFRVLIAVALGGIVAASPSVRASSIAEGHPWDKAQAVVADTERDAQKSGMQGIRPHIADLEHALAGAPAAFSAPDARTGPVQARGRYG
jgi:hypothetical protein